MDAVKFINERRRMCDSYNMKGARDVPALRIGRRYREMMGGDAGEPEEETAGHDMG